MPGIRHGAKPRAAWEHPQDLVRLIDEMPGDFNREALQKIAWLHDLLEDGIKEDGTAVTTQDLQQEGIDLDTIGDVEALSQPPDEEKTAYLFRVRGASLRARIVKCVDRICNLREGKTSFKDGRWARYVKQTYEYIFPLVHELPDPLKDWVTKELQAAIAARPVS